MAIKARKTVEALVYALVKAHNLRQEEGVGSSFHADTTQKTTGSDFRNPTVTDDLVTSANASDLATAITLVNEMKKVVNRHFADTRAHNTAVSAAVATADASDLATAITLANDLKAAYNTHRTAANVHFTNDGTNAVAAADASDQATLETLLNEMKGDINAHIVGAPAGAMIELIDP